jgi:hypothetical protein
MVHSTSDFDDPPIQFRKQTDLYHCCRMMDKQTEKETILDLEDLPWVSYRQYAPD